MIDKFDYIKIFQYEKQNKNYISKIKGQINSLKKDISIFIMYQNLL